MNTEKPVKRWLTVCYLWRGEEECPFIRLSGQWLRDLGFASGDTVAVEGGPGCLLLRLVGKGPGVRTKSRGRGK